MKRRKKHNTTPNNMRQDQHTDKRNKKNEKRKKQLKIIDKLNQAGKGNNFWKAAEILLNQNQ